MKGYIDLKYASNIDIMLANNLYTSCGAIYVSVRAKNNYYILRLNYHAMQGWIYIDIRY